MDVSFGDGVEAAAGQQDDVGLRALRHGSPRSSLVPVPVLVPVLSRSVELAYRGAAAAEREGGGEEERGGGRDGEIERGREGEKREGGRERETGRGAGGGGCGSVSALQTPHRVQGTRAARRARAQSFP